MTITRFSNITVTVTGTKMFAVLKAAGVPYQRVDAVWHAPAWSVDAIVTAATTMGGFARVSPEVRRIRPGQLELGEAS